MKSTAQANVMLDLRYGDGAFVRPATIYVALFTAAPTVAGGGTEVAGGSYARAAITNDLANFADAVAGQKSNANPVTFATATAAWGTVVAVGIFDAAVVGNLLDFVVLTGANIKPVSNGDQYSIPAGSLVLTES